MARRSTQAKPADYGLVGGLAVLCLALVIAVLHRSQGSTPPARPPTAATATLQSQTPVPTQAGPVAGAASQPSTATAAPSQPPATAAIGVTQPTPLTPVAVGTVSGATPQPTIGTAPRYRQGQNM